MHGMVLRSQPCVQGVGGHCKDASFSTLLKTELTSEINRRADLEVLNIRVAQQTDLLVDVTLRHDLFHGRQALWGVG
jgi:hypothetical protein